LKQQDGISRDINESYHGQTLRVLVDGVSRRGDVATVSARTDGNKLVHFAADGDRVGEFCKIKITEI
jgi:tRNA A37 methylthiotransferase MiaB